MPRTLYLPCVLLALFMGTCGCTGGLGQGAIDPTDSNAKPGEEVASSGRTFSTSPGIRRLTQVEYKRSVESLTGASTADLSVPEEFINAHHSQIAGAQKVGYTDVERFALIAEGIALERTDALLNEAGCGEDDAACTREWARSFLDLAWRAAVAPQSSARHMSLLDEARAGDTVRARAQTFVAAALCSPYFLYRTEIGASPVPSTQQVELTPAEIATRMSYLVWQSTPDRPLLDAAARGELASPEGRLAALERLMQDPRAKDGVRAFVADWMGVFGPNLGSKDADVLQGTNAQLAQEAARSFERSVDDILIDAKGGYLELLSTDRVFVTPQLAQIMGVPHDGAQEDGLAQATLPAHRLGLLTHPLVLGAHTKESGASPFPIGAFIYENILCETIPVFENIPDEVAGVDERELTLRQRLEARTEGQPCAACHVKIGPSGFSFLPFDPVGRYSGEDALGRPWDTTGEVPVGQGGELLAFGDQAELARGLAAHPQAAQCVADRLFRWTHGRYEGPGDAQAIAELRELSVAQQSASGALLRALVSSDSFTQARHK